MHLVFNARLIWLNGGFYCIVFRKDNNFSLCLCLFLVLVIS